MGDLPHRLRGAQAPRDRSNPARVGRVRRRTEIHTPQRCLYPRTPGEHARIPDHDDRFVRRSAEHAGGSAKGCWQAARQGHYPAWNRQEKGSLIGSADEFRGAFMISLTHEYTDGKGRHARGWLFYDAEGAFCTRIPRWVAGPLYRRGLGVAPLQDPRVGSLLNVTREELLRELRYLDEGGVLH